MPAVTMRRGRLRNAETFAQDLASIATLRALWIPSPGDTTSNALKPDGRTWTNSATIQGRITYQGNGILVSLNGTDQYASTGDTADLSVGNGTTDGPLSIVALANVTNTASFRTIIGKYSAVGSLQEYVLYITDADKLGFYIYDVSAAAQPHRDSDAAVTQGTLGLFGVTYTAVTGGANAANDITMYENGAVKASTATPAAGYVAMENGTADLMIGARGTAASPEAGLYLPASVGFAVIYAAALTAAQHRQIANLVNEFYGVSL